MYKITETEDQQKFVVPLNRETEKMFYNLRMIIDAKVLTEPRAWQITKVNRISPNGLVRVTLGQDNFDQHKDYIELDENGIVVGMWADFYSNGSIAPDNPIDDKPTIHSEITYSGTKPEIKIGGSNKTFTVKFYNDEGEIQHRRGRWEFKIDGVDASSLLTISEPTENQVKVKFVGNDSYIGKVLTVSYTSIDGIKSDVDVNVIGI